jgi:hypothetical protein
MITKAEYSRAQSLLDPERVHYNRQPTLAEIADGRGSVIAYCDALRAIQRRLAAKFPPGTRLTRIQQAEAADVRSDLLNLERGFTRDICVHDEELRQYVDLPGLAAAERLVARLDRLYEKEAARLAQVWPRPFRYTGRPGDAMIGDRALEPGDVVDLNESQARAFGDRFEPVAAS